METEQAEAKVDVRVDDFVQTMNERNIKRVSLEELHYPVMVCDDDHCETSPNGCLYQAANVDALKGFINGYMWGTISYPEVPPLRIVDMPYSAPQFRVTIIELQSPIVIRECTIKDDEDLARRIKQRRMYRAIPR